MRRVILAFPADNSTIEVAFWQNLPGWWLSQHGLGSCGVFLQVEILWGILGIFLCGVGQRSLGTWAWAVCCHVCQLSSLAGKAFGRKR